MKRLIAAALGVVALGCGGVAQDQQMHYTPVKLIPTRTPGVAFVVVTPRMPVTTSGVSQPGDGATVSAMSQYVMLCDARPANGMQCSLITEASTERYSYTPSTGNASAPLDEGVGTLTSVIRVDHEGACISGDELREAVQAATPPPAAAPRPAAAPPPAPAAAPQPVAPVAPATPAAVQPRGVQP